MAAEVAFLVGLGDRVPVLVDPDGDRPGHRTDARVVRFDAAVEDADGDALAGRAAERPLAVDRTGEWFSSEIALTASSGSDHAGHSSS